MVKQEGEMVEILEDHSITNLVDIIAIILIVEKVTAAIIEDTKIAEEKEIQDHIKEIDLSETHL